MLLQPDWLGWNWTCSSHWMGQVWTCPNQSSDCNQQLHVAATGLVGMELNLPQPLDGTGLNLSQPIKWLLLCNVYLVHWLYIPLLFELKHTHIHTNYQPYSIWLNYTSFKKFNCRKLRISWNITKMLKTDKFFHVTFYFWKWGVFLLLWLQ